MKVISKNDGWLTNYEVYVSLTAEQIRQSDKDVRKMPTNSQAIQRQVLRYLQDYTPVEAMSADSMKACLQDLASYGLAQSETLELLNHAPQSDVFTYMVRFDAACWMVLGSVDSFRNGFCFVLVLYDSHSHAFALAGVGIGV
jgi:hypothetical protein